MGSVAGQNEEPSSLLAPDSSVGASSEVGQPPTQSAAYKVGVVNLDQVFKGYDKQQAEYAALKKERDVRQVDLDALSKKVEDAKARLETHAASMTEEEQLDLREEINADFGTYEAEFKRLQGDIDRMEKRILERLFRDIDQAIAQVGARDNYHLVFESGRKGTSGLLYSSPTLNMTRKVTDLLNEQFHQATKSQ